jgi:hypothetical protein
LAPLLPILTILSVTGRRYFFFTRLLDPLLDEPRDTAERLDPDLDMLERVPLE